MKRIVATLVTLLTFSSAPFANTNSSYYTFHRNCAGTGPQCNGGYYTLNKNAPLSAQNAYGGYVTKQQYDMYANHISGPYSATYRASLPPPKPIYKCTIYMAGGATRPC